MSYQLELRHLKYFLAVANELHFRKAAEQLYISQPGLSKQIKELENSLGIPLFERHNRKVALTTAGEYLKTELKLNLHALEQTLHHAKLLDDGQIGELRLGYVGSAMQEIIPNLLQKFKDNLPKIRYSLKEMDNQNQIEALLKNEIDVGFVRMDQVPQGLFTFPVLNEAFCLVLPDYYIWNDKDSLGLESLKEESFILFDSRYSPSYYAKVMEIFTNSSFQPKISHNTIHAGSIFTLVQKGFGISIVPKSLKAKHFEGVKYVDLDHLPQRTVLLATWRESNRNPLLNSLKQIIQTEYGEVE
jgi:DNA-binding transcriptional LysR family regulator